MRNYPETVINAFLSNSKISDIMKQTGLSRSTIERYRSDPELQKILTQRREMMLQGVLDSMRASLQPAADKLIAIILDPETPRQTTVNAISTLFANTKALIETVELSRRLADLEGQRAEIEELWRKIQGARHG